MTWAEPPAKRRNLTPWLAGAAALIALAVLLWAVLGGGRGGEREEQARAGARRAPTVGAVDAVPLPPADGSPLAALGGPGSAVAGEQPFYPGGVATPPAGQRRTAARTRPAQRRRADRAASDSPGYRVIGPGASDAPSAPPEPAPAPPPPPPEE